MSVESLRAYWLDPLYSRTPRGVRGLKFTFGLPVDSARSRTPRGVRGLKYILQLTKAAKTPSHPSRGAWIEICNAQRTVYDVLRSHPSRGAWIEI